MEHCRHSVVPRLFARLTVKPSGTAGDQNAALALSLHVRQESLDGLNGAQEVNLQNLPHRVQGLHLQRPHQTHTSIAHCDVVRTTPLTRTNYNLNRGALTQEHTQNVHSFLHNPVPRIQDGLMAGHVHLEYVQGVPVQAFHTL